MKKLKHQQQETKKEKAIFCPLISILVERFSHRSK